MYVSETMFTLEQITNPERFGPGFILQTQNMNRELKLSSFIMNLEIFESGT